MTTEFGDGEVFSWYAFLTALSWLAQLALLRAAAERYGGESSLRSDYETDPLPRFAPPSWLFAPVWSALYVLLCIVGFRLRTQCGGWAGSPATAPLALLVVSLALLVVWPAIYSGMRRKRLGILIQMVLLGVAITLCVLAWDCDVVSGVLTLPFAVWLGFALILACAIERRRAGLAPGMLGTQLGTQLGGGGGGGGSGGGGSGTTQRGASRAARHNGAISVRSTPVSHMPPVPPPTLSSGEPDYASCKLVISK